MTQGQKTCRIIAWAFSLISIVIYAIMFVVFLLSFAVYNGLFSEEFGSNTLLTIAIMMLLFGFIQLIFFILNLKASKDEKTHIALGVLQIIFGGLISGILILCSGGKPKQTQSN